MTKKGETDNYTATDFVEKIEKYLGRPATYIIANNAPIPEQVLLQYSLEQKVEFDTQGNTSDLRLVSAPLAMVSEEGHVLTSPERLRTAIEQILQA